MEPASGEHTYDHEQSAALHALDLLEDLERHRFEAHLAGCRRCEQIVREDRRIVAALAEAAPEMDPSPGFRERLLSRAEQELHESGLAKNGV